MEDYLITGGRVVDGTGNPWFYGDVVLRGERVARVGPAGRAEVAGAREVVDATGMVVCPGFIDIQSQSAIPFLTDGRSLSKLTQGVTTEIMGEHSTPAPFGGKRRSAFLEGFGRVSEDDEQRARQWARFGDWLDDLASRPAAVNVGSFVGAGTIREYAMGWATGAPSPQELATMCRLTAEAMEDGAFGIAPALIYPPSTFSTEAELIELARVVGQSHGTYIVHLRSEGAGLLESLTDTIELARQARVAVEIYHFKACGEGNWHLLPEAIALIDRARADGVGIAANMYPYVASATGLGATLPEWVFADGKLEENLRDPAARARIREDILHDAGRGVLAGPDGTLVVGLRRPEHAAYLGKTLGEVAAARGQDWIDALMDLVLAEGAWAGAIYFLMTEENLVRQMRQPWVKFSTDAGGFDPDLREGVLVHPRAYGTYPRVLGKYVREEKVLPLEDAIRKMTSAVADRLGLRDRGLLRAGCCADVVIFDPRTVADRATFAQPHQLSVGIRDVWVNGRRVLDGGSYTGALPGRCLYGPGRSA